MAGDAPLDALLPRLRRPPGLPAERVQHVLPRLPGSAAAGLLLLLQGAPTRRAPGHPDTAVVVPRRGSRLRGGGRPRHHRRPDLRHQQRQGPLPQRAPPAAWRRRRRGQGRRVPVQLRDLRTRAARPLPILLPRMQVGGHQEEQRPRRGHRRAGHQSSGGGGRREQEQAGTAAEGDPSPRALLVLTTPTTSTTGLSFHYGWVASPPPPRRRCEKLAASNAVSYGSKQWRPAMQAMAAMEGGHATRIVGSTATRISFGCTYYSGLLPKQTRKRKRTEKQVADRSGGQASPTTAAALALCVPISLSKLYSSHSHHTIPASTPFIP